MGLIFYMQNFSAPSRAVAMTIAALGINVQKKIIDLSKKEHLTEGFLKINPQHSIPTLDDDGKIIWDSHAINAYLVDKYAKGHSLYPQDLHHRAIIDQRLHFDSGVVFPWLRHIARGIKYKGRTSLTDDQIEHLDEAYTHLDNFVKGQKWVTGDTLTIADFNLVTSIVTLNVIFPVKSQKYPNLSAWLDRSRQLPYFEKVNKEGLEDFKKMMAPIL